MEDVMDTETELKCLSQKLFEARPSSRAALLSIAMRIIEIVQADLHAEESGCGDPCGLPLNKGVNKDGRNRRI